MTIQDYSSIQDPPWASAAVVSALEQRMQWVECARGKERSGGAWFERGEGGGVT